MAFVLSEPALLMWRPDLLVRLFRHHGVDVTTQTLMDSWTRMCQTDGPPVQLLDALAQVQELGTEANLDALLESVGGRMFSGFGQETPADVALIMLLDHTESYHRVRTRVPMRRRARREFQGSVTTTLMGPPNPTALERAEAWLGASFQARRRSGHCRIQAYELDGLLHFEVFHGGTLRRKRTIEGREDQLEVGHLEYRPEQYDLVTYDPMRGILSIAARDKCTMQACRDAFGLLLHNDLVWFRQPRLLSLEPLSANQRAALQPVDGIARVCLRGLDLLDSAGDPFKVGPSSDAFATLSRNKLRIEDFELCTARLAVTFYDGSTAKVTLQKPNTVTQLTGRSQVVMQQFLVKRGFLVQAGACG